MKKSHWIALTLLFLVGCGMTEKRPEVALESRVQFQHQWLANLLPGQAIETVLEPVLAYHQYSVETLEEGQMYQYVQGQYPGTNVLFGIYFEDSKLTTLILDQQVTDFAICRLPSRHKNLHWLDAKGAKPFSNWMKEQNQLGKIPNTMIVHPPSDNDTSSSIGAYEMVEAASYLPIIAVALPFYVMDRVSGGFQADKKRNSQRAYLTKVAREIGLGASKDELIRLLGSPDQERLSGDAIIWDYRLPHISFGIIDELVIWKESFFRGIPRNSGTIFGETDCSGITGGN